MRSTAVFFLYLVVCLVCGALLTYPLMQTGWIHHDPHRVMGRLAEVFILLGLWPLLKTLGMSARADFGYDVSKSGFWRSLAAGWGMGVAILCALVAVLYGLEIRVPDLPLPGAGAIAVTALEVLIAGLLIATLEETFFRGILFGSIRRREGRWSAILWTAGLYGLLHFMKPSGLPDGMVFDWSGAFYMFVHVFTDPFQWHHLDSFIALFCVGIFLALVRERTGHIGWGIGLHAGWVFVIQLSRHLTDGNPQSEWSFLVGDYDGTIGWLAALWISLLALGYWVWSGRREG